MFACWFWFLLYFGDVVIFNSIFLFFGVFGFLDFWVFGFLGFWVSYCNFKK